MLSYNKGRPVFCEINVVVDLHDPIWHFKNSLNNTSVSPEVATEWTILKYKHIEWFLNKENYSFSLLKKCNWHQRATAIRFVFIRFLPAAKWRGEDFLPAVSLMFTLGFKLTILRTLVTSPFLQASNNSLPPSQDSASKLWLLCNCFLVAILAWQPHE